MAAADPRDVNINAKGAISRITERPERLTKGEKNNAEIT